MTRLKVGIAAGFALAVVGTSLWLNAAESSPPTATPIADAQLAFPVLRDKIVAITIKSDPSYSTYLRGVRPAQLGNSFFLVGERYDSEAEGKTAGRRVWVAVDDISEMIEFDDAADLEKFMEQEETGPDA